MKYYTRKQKEYSAGELIVRENTESDGVYIIDKGRVRVYKTISKHGEQEEVELCQLGPKAMFGEMAMIDESKRSASVKALGPTVCTIISKQIFEEQLSKMPPWMLNMIRIMVTRLRETNDKLKAIIEQTQLDSPETIAPDDFLMVENNAIISGTQMGNTLKSKPAPQSSTGETTLNSDEIITDLFQKE